MPKVSSPLPRHRWPFIRLPRRKPNPLLVRTLTPLPAVIAAIDCASRCSGYALLCRGELAGFGEAKTTDPLTRHRIVDQALELGRVEGLPVGLVLETPYGGTLRTILPLHASVTLWRDSWLAAAQPLGHVLEVHAREWRRVLFGAARMSRADARRLELITATRAARQHGFADVHVGPDAAAAMCLALASRHSAELGAQLELPIEYARKARRA